MDAQEKEYFEILSKDRTENANTLDKASMRGIRNSVVEKYSDQAHFIYELLQNADDAHATSARFSLKRDQLIFVHNGTSHFSISDPRKENNNPEAPALGDINAITSIGNSSKPGGGSTIGKFGVGFKAVYQYTRSPRIYDKNFKFKIERFIVPVLLDEDFPGRKPDETVFVFPLNHPERPAKKAFEDIADKLKNLKHPLLFMSSLKKILFSISGIKGAYSKNIQDQYENNDMKAEKITLIHEFNGRQSSQGLWLFSRQYGSNSNLKYSVGYFLDHQGKLEAVEEPAYCFFPTKETTGLNFIIHAPFLLTDSREGVRAGIEHNEDMISRLANLAADALPELKRIGNDTGNRLIDDNIVNIIPVDPNKFSSVTSKDKVSFKPIYDAIFKKFKTEELLPSTEGYTASRNAYWASVPQIPKIFSNEQLQDICGNPNAKWIFPSLGRDDTLKRSNKALSSYIDALARTSINEDIILGGRKRNSTFNTALNRQQALEVIKGITPEFIEKQSVKWLASFYEWISETTRRTENAKNKPIFWDTNRKASCAYDKNNRKILFLPVAGADASGYKVVHQDLLCVPKIKEFIIKMGIQEPSLHDQIYNIILKQYKGGDIQEADRYFKIFYDYYCKCDRGESDNLIDEIKELEFLTYEKPLDCRPRLGRANSMYFSWGGIHDFLDYKHETRFLTYGKYEKLASDKLEYLIGFLEKLGVKTKIGIIEHKISPKDFPVPIPKSYTKTHPIKWTEKTIDGCYEILDHIERALDKDASVLLWNTLIDVIKNYSNETEQASLNDLLCGKCTYFYHTDKILSFSSPLIDYLKNKKWIFDNNGNFSSPNKLTKGTLPARYKTNGIYAESLMKFLDIAASESDRDDSVNLTASQRQKISLANKLREYGIDNLDDLEEFREYRMRKEQAAQARTATDERENTDKSSDELSYKDKRSSISDDWSPSEGKGISQETVDVVKDIIRKTHGISNSVNDSADSDATLEADQDELMPSPIDYSKKIERAKQKSAREIEKITYIESLQKKATAAKKYSFGWFKSLLEMECLSSAESNSNSREVSISFSVVEKEPGTLRTLVLKQPSRYIPQFIEDLADIPLVLHMGDATKTVPIEVASIQSYTLRVKMKNTSAIDGIDLSSVTEARIDASSPAFLIEELRKQFAQFDYPDDYDMQTHLCSNIDFIFGPPGTGKTTYLASKVLIPLIRSNKQCKILVLTPTNKSADVLTRRVMELSKSSKDYDEWLVRFGAAGDEEIEQSPVFKDKTFDIEASKRNVTVTTIARFPYDFFMPPGRRIFLNGINWDYIVIDEASMIPIASIVLPLYKKTPKKFIIAGDPFQIEPITAVEMWKDENIYKMVRLDSFSQNPNTVPHHYHVELLTTQYRSIPDIGEIFSRFAYKGILKHSRTAASQKKLNLDSSWDIRTLNILKFPVSKYESIYRAKRLQHSSAYQIYSAIFTSEYVSCLAKAIAAQKISDTFRIGIIAPYRAQADMIDKLLAKETPKRNVDIQVGTIHGFQGDECDMIFAVFNAPPTISSSPNMFLNKKNIINVSISRARDYLFIVMPDDDTENVDNLKLIKRVERLIKSTSNWNESLTPDIEQKLFGNSKYIEDNAFSTSHQSVNVYGLPEKCYEVRTEDMAVDVQVHRAAPKAVPIIKEPVKNAERLGTEEIPSRFSNEEKTHDSTPDRQEEMTASISTKETNHSSLENLPSNLMKKARKISVIGMNEPCYLIPYKGKLKRITPKPSSSMFIPIISDNKNKNIPVSVLKDEKIVFIPESNFRRFEKEIFASESINLKESAH